MFIDLSESFIFCFKFETVPLFSIILISLGKKHFNFFLHYYLIWRTLITILQIFDNHLATDYLHFVSKRLSHNKRSTLTWMLNISILISVKMYEIKLIFRFTFPMMAFKFHMNYPFSCLMPYLICAHVFTSDFYQIYWKHWIAC